MLGLLVGYLQELLLRSETACSQRLCRVRGEAVLHQYNLVQIVF